VRYVFVGSTGAIADVIRYVARKGHQVIVFDNTREGVEDLEAELGVTGAVVDLLNLQDLEEFGFSKADVVVIGHRYDSINVALAAYAKRVGIPKVVVVTANRDLANVIRSLGLASDVVVVNDVVSKAIVNSIHEFASVDVTGDLVVLVVRSNALGDYVGRTIRELREDLGVEVLKVVSSDGTTSNPSDDHVIKEGETLVVLAKRSDVERLTT
jgi:Trk K+ transport system NAD-binding subunit